MKSTSTIPASAVFEIESTTKGFLPPRMTTVQRDAISSPATGLQVYNTTTNTNDFYNGTAWGSDAPSSLYVPYTGATGAVNLGAFDLTVNSIKVGKGGGAVATNTGLGVTPLNLNTTGSNNTAIGNSALFYNTTASNNTATGSEALFRNTGVNNTALGNGALREQGAANANTAVGQSAMYNNLTGSNNTALGRFAGNYISGGVTSNTITNNSIFLGYDTRALADNQTNQTVIGYQATGLGSNTTVINNSSTTNTSINGRVNIFGATDNSLFSLNSGATLYTVGFSPTATASSTNTFTLTTGTTTWIYTGTGLATWTLPTPSGTNQMFWIKNAGTGVITLNAFAGSNIIDNSATSVSSITIAVGATVLIQQDGNVKSYQLQ
jgi:hypothetical protein